MGVYLELKVHVRDQRFNESDFLVLRCDLDVSVPHELMAGGWGGGGMEFEMIGVTVATKPQQQ